MTISKEQWADIEGKLKYHHAYFNFQYQDTEVSVIRVGKGEGKTALAVYLNGQICCGWGWPSSDAFNPLVEHFWSKRSKSLYSPIKVKKLEKIYGKRRAKKEIPNLQEKMTWYQPYFSKASVVVRQFKKIKGLVLVEGRNPTLDNKDSADD